ncbi:Uridylate kinase [Candidatus Providencia siddallii]|uniref:Uridylate kinase n=1 Tax=Candidatus Providencia siddallii TaxID=1715285 RepID=A0A0M6WA47_9GAMM|nr:Uridylate kinase [Candidatus Providencia siddallii]
MTTSAKLIYQRILLKLSGEALLGKESFGIDFNALTLIAQEIKILVNLGIQIGVVVGGGNLFRGSGLMKTGINRVVCDQMGMLATIMNGLAIKDALNRIHVKTRLMSAIPLNSICDIYNSDYALKLLHDNNIIIFSAGIGNPFFTTDSAACLRGVEIKADIILKATNVDGVYSSDPNKDHKAIMYKKLNFKEALKQELRIMDLTAFALARDHNLPIRIFNMNKPDILRRIALGENEGTLISND